MRRREGGIEETGEGEGSEKTGGGGDRGDRRGGRK